MITFQAEIVHKAIFSHGGYGPTLGWHKAEYRGYNSQDDAGELLRSYPTQPLSLTSHRSSLVISSIPPLMMILPP